MAINAGTSMRFPDRTLPSSFAQISDEDKLPKCLNFGCCAQTQYAMDRPTVADLGSAFTFLSNSEAAESGQKVGIRIGFRHKRHPLLAVEG
jgi:hypothetical protein